MRKNAYAVPLILVFLALFLVRTPFFNVAYGNFTMPFPITNPPVISIISPTNTTYETKVLLRLNIKTAFLRFQNINHVSYTLDTQEYVAYSGETKDLKWSICLEGLSEGAHSLKVYASCISYYVNSTTGGNEYRIYNASSEVVYFTVVNPPEISILSLKNETYNTNNISLDFTVNEPVSKIEYCMDGQEKLVIDGNVTLNGLSDGLHTVTVYATDMDGRVGLSETAYFEIDTFPTTFVIAAVVVVAVVLIGIGLLVYLIKRR